MVNVGHLPFKRDLHLLLDMKGALTVPHTSATLQWPLRIVIWLPTHVLYEVALKEYN